MSTESMLSEVRKNTRLRGGLWMIIGICAFYGVLILQEHVAAAKARYEAAARQLQRAEAMAAEAGWDDRLTEIKGIEAQYEARLWRETNPALAQASLQDWLNGIAKGVGINNARIAVTFHDESKPEAVSADKDDVIETNLWKVSARLGGDFAPATLHSLLAALAKHERLVVVEALSVRTINVNPRFELQLAAWFRPASSPQKEVK